MFFEYVSNVFGELDFKGWYDHGLWEENFIPNSIVIEDKIIANVSVTIMDIIVDGSPKKGVQLGAVGTLPAYRKQGMSRHLIEFALEKYGNPLILFSCTPTIRF